MAKAKKDTIKEITAKLETGVKEVLTSEKYQEFLNCMAKFHNYSFNNCLLIAMQKPDASLVAGYKAWQTKFKRQVRKGETAIKILAPMPCKFKKEIETDDGIEEQEISYTRYRAVNVFDISQTDGEELPTYKVNNMTGDVDEYQELVDKLIAISPVPVGFEDIEGRANGFFHRIDKRIAIQDGMSQIQTVKTMVHEIAHSILHDKDDGLEKEANRYEKEVQAESVAYVVNQYLGIDTSDYSFGYIAGYSTGKDTKELTTSLQVIRDTAHSIIEGLGM